MQQQVKVQQAFTCILDKKDKGAVASLSFLINFCRILHQMFFSMYKLLNGFS